MLLFLLWLLAVAQAGSECPISSYKTDDQLLQIATYETVHEIREAASRVFARRLGAKFLESFKTGEFFPLDYLEELERSPSVELRTNLPLAPLEFAYLQALAEGGLTLDQLVAGIDTGETFQLRLARAMTVVHLLFNQEIIGMSLQEFISQQEDYYHSLAEGRFPEITLEFSQREREAILELWPTMEELLQGQEVEIWGYRFNGTLPAARRAFSWIGFLLAPPELGFSTDEVLKLRSPDEWLELAENGTTTELRWIAAFIYFTRFLPQELDELQRLATEGGSHEVRYLAAWLLMERLSEEREPTPEELLDWATHGASAELRQWAAYSLEFEFWSACRNEEEIAGQRVTPEWLYKLAKNGETKELRWAAGAALGWCWRSRMELARRLGLGEGLSISDIPRQSEVKAQSLEQALIIYATENTIIYPEAAQAAIPVLIALYGLPEANVVFSGPGGN